MSCLECGQGDYRGVIIGLWKSTAVIANVLQLKGKRKVKLVQGRRPVVIRLVVAQLITLFAARLVYVGILIVYFVLHA